MDASDREYCNCQYAGQDPGMRNRTRDVTIVSPDGQRVAAGSHLCGKVLRRSPCTRCRHSEAGWPRVDSGALSSD
eukprot:3334811-Prymnesium_polylepis.2